MPRSNVSRPNVPRELTIVVAAAGIYFGVRELVQGTTADALRNADRIVDLEAAVGLDLEPRLQEAVLDNDLVRTIGNLSYVWLHWPLLIAVLIFLLLYDFSRYRQLRNAMCLSGAIALVIFALFPVAPPRFLPGFTGTVSDEARLHYLSIPLSWSNPYASFPSFHVGWTLVACLALAASIPGRHATVAAMVPALLVAISTITTGNHYVIDAIGGTAIALAAYLHYGRREASRRVRDDLAQPSMREM